MTQYLYQPYVFDQDKEYEFIGIGQIVDPKTYKLFCVPNKGGNKGEDAKGWGERYKVRLCFRNSDETNDEDLIDATRNMSFPSGHAGLQIYVPLAPNTFVNIHKNRLNRQYIISSVIGSSLCSFSDSKDPGKGCAPKSGFGAGIGGFTVPDTNTDGGKVVNENGAGADCTISNSDKQLLELNKYVFAPSACNPIDSNAINRDLINLKKDIEGLRNKINGPNSALSNAEKFLNEAQQKVSSYADKITGWIKWLVNEIKLRIEKGVNWAVNKTKTALYLNQRFQLQEKKTTALDLIACLFNKILDNLSSLIEQFLNQILGRYVNMATCAIEKFLTELVGQIIGQILAAVNGILGAVLGTIAGIKGLVDSVLNAIISLLDFLSCDVKAECPDVKEWNFLEGGKSSRVSLDINSIFNSAKSIISSAKSIVDPNNFKFNLDINSMIVGVNDACNIGPILCGPPKISFFGGGGQGATGNAIVSATGDILGIDIVSPGFGYTKAPLINIEDSCGRGKGATAIAVIGNTQYFPPSGTGGAVGTGATNGTGTGTGTGIGTLPKTGEIVSGITKVVIIDNGTEYLPKPDGSKGGDERTWATRCQSTIRRADGNWDYPYNPGEIMNIKVGDYVQLVDQSPFISATEEVITAPECPPEETPITGPTTPDGSYPVILELIEVEITNPGFGYTSGNTVVVTPNNGAELTPQFGYNGQLTGVTVVNTGIGFTEVPEIGIDSSTGHNAVIKPVFRVLKGDELITKLGAVDTIINVVDCVGKPG
jgi:hypothetical protein